MGGDRGPAVVLEGALSAVRDGDIAVVLVGTADAVADVPELPDRTVEIRATNAVIAMGDDPETAVRTGRGSSLVRCAELGRAHEVDGVVTAGNTGAAVLATATRLGRLPGVVHPVIASVIPTLRGGKTVLVDSGATVDPPAAWMRQFAALGAAYATVRCGVVRPRIGLLGNGTEEGKGDAFRRAALAELADMEGFTGFVEGYDLVSGAVDVVVSDGFTGNVALKAYESGMRSAVAALEDGFPGGRKAAFERLGAGSDFGAVLLGVRGVVVILHGAATATAVDSGVRLAADLVRNGLLDRFRVHLRRAVTRP